MQYIISCYEGNQELLLSEFKYYKIKGTWHEINDTMALFETSIPKQTLLNIIQTEPLFYVAHLFEVIDMEVESMILPKGSEFSIQLRSDAAVRKEAMQLRDAAITMFESQGHTLNIKEPNVIIPMVYTEKDIFIGIETPETQLSAWNGGVIRYRMDESLISRSEFKLREAFELFNLELGPGLALDMGAAPGGWSYVLHDTGFDVISVDPAKLDFNVENLPNLRHYRMAIQEYVALKQSQSLDLIVNDMKMIVDKSVSLTQRVAEQLSEDGLVIMTLKLRKNHAYHDVLRALSTVEQSFDIVQGRALHTNRSEVTVVLKNKAMD